MSDDVTAAGLRVMGRLLEEDVGPGVAFALFVDWRDGRALSYLSNGNRSDVVAALGEWLGRTGRGEPTLAAERGEVPALEARCAALGRQMVEEDIDVVLFLFTSGDGGETAWFSSIARGRDVVEDWVKTERSRS